MGPRDLTMLISGLAHQQLFIDHPPTAYLAWPRCWGYKAIEALLSWSSHSGWEKDIKCVYK